MDKIYRKYIDERRKRARTNYRVYKKSHVGNYGVLPTGGNIIGFSGDLDKVIASFIIANGLVTMGSKITMFFTFWGLNILRKSNHVRVKKTFLERMFGRIMPRGA